jgi:hypothetical protein
MPFFKRNETRRINGTDESGRLRSQRRLRVLLIDENPTARRRAPPVAPQLRRRTG